MTKVRGEDIENVSATKGATEDDTPDITEEGHREISTEENPNDIYIWRCVCGKECNKFGWEWTQHIAEGKKRGEDHKWQLIDKRTGEVVADSPTAARVFLKKGGSASPSNARGKVDKTKADDNRPPFKPYTAIVEKFVQYTGELDGRLLLLYEMTLPLYQARGYEPTVEEWIEDVITQFYREHAEDFKFDQVMKKFVEGSKDVVN